MEVHTVTVYVVLQLRGCQLACQFHREGSPQRVPVLVTQGHQVIRREGSMVSWPRPVVAPVVYVVMCQRPGQPWRQLLQTVDLTARVPENEVLRVLVVGRNGLVTIYRTISNTAPPADDAREVLRLVGSETLRALRLPAPGNRRINTQLFSEPSQNPLDMLVSPVIT